MFIICKSIFKITGDPILCWATCSTPRFMLTEDSYLWWTFDVTPMGFFLKEFVLSSFALF